MKRLSKYHYIRRKNKCKFNHDHHKKNSWKKDTRTNIFVSQTFVYKRGRVTTSKCISKWTRNLAFSLTYTTLSTVFFKLKWRVILSMFKLRFVFVISRTARIRRKCFISLWIVYVIYIKFYDRYQWAQKACNHIVSYVFKS